MYQDAEGIFHRQFAESRDKSGKWTKGGEAGHGSPEGDYAKNGDKWQHTTASPKKTDDVSVSKNKTAQGGHVYEVHVGGVKAGDVYDEDTPGHHEGISQTSGGVPRSHDSVHKAIDHVVAHGRQKQLDTVRSAMKNRPGSAT